jgi:hypothetical protein
VPAIIDADGPVDDPWAALGEHARGRPADEVAARVQLLDVPASVLGEPTGPPIVVRAIGDPAPAARPAPVVVDLSSLWAGPLCARLLGANGARVLAVHNVRRPDPTRDTMPGLHAHLRTGHEDVRLDLGSVEGRDRLLALLRTADVVIEAARPRALQRLDIDAERLLIERAGVTWVSITAHGRTGPGADRVGFGDDAAVAGGAVAFDGRDEPVFCGDAIADPLTGLYAAGAALASIAAGGGHLIALALRDVAADALVVGGPMPPHETIAVGADRWRVRCGGAEASVSDPVVP